MFGNFLTNYLSHHTQINMKWFCFPFFLFVLFLDSIPETKQKKQQNSNIKNKNKNTTISNNSHSYISPSFGSHCNHKKTTFHRQNHPSVVRGVSFFWFIKSFAESVTKRSFQMLAYKMLNALCTWFLAVFFASTAFFVKDKKLYIP